MTEKERSAGRWKAGQSGNPKGKVPGTGKLQQLRSSIATHLPDIITKLVEQAKAGDAQSARLLLERVLPPVKPTEAPVSIELPDGSMADQGRAIVRAVGAGAVAPGQAAQMLSGLGALAKVIEVDELAERVRKLEERHAKS